MVKYQVQVLGPWVDEGSQAWRPAICDKSGACSDVMSTFDTPDGAEAMVAYCRKRASRYAWSVNPRFRVVEICYA